MNNSNTASYGAYLARVLGVVLVAIILGFLIWFVVQLASDDDADAPASTTSTPITIDAEEGQVASGNSITIDEVENDGSVAVLGENDSFGSDVNGSDNANSAGLNGSDSTDASASGATVLPETGASNIALIAAIAGIATAAIVRFADQR